MMKKSAWLLYEAQDAVKNDPVPMLARLVLEYGADPYLVLIACLLSLRARDEVVYQVVKKLLLYLSIRPGDQKALAQFPQKLSLLSVPELEQFVYSSGMYKTKARVLAQVTQAVLQRERVAPEQFVPDSLPLLLQLPGVGLKTANLVLAYGFGIPAIGVDVHVHRITNRWGIIATKTPEQTEQQLRKIYESNAWLIINTTLVPFGNRWCLPRFPRCATCPLRARCSYGQKRTKKQVGTHQI